MSKAESEDVQRNEIEALQSIYPEEFELLEETVKTVWSKAAVPSFQILIDLTKDDVTRSVKASMLPSLKLRVEYTTFYPRTAPILAIKETKGLLQSDIGVLQRSMEETVKARLGSEMIYDVIDNLKMTMKQFIRADHAPSLIEERESRLISTTQHRIASEEDRAETKARSDAEEHAALQARIDQDLMIKAKARTMSSHSKLSRRIAVSALVTINFSRAFTVRQYTIDAVTLNAPIVPNDAGMTRPWVSYIPEVGQLIVKEFPIYSADPEAIRSIETAIQALLPEFWRHEKPLGVQNYGYTLQEQDKNRQTLFVVQEYASHGSLADLLRVVGKVPIQQAKAWCMDLAEELSNGHRYGLVHRHLDASKVLLYERAGRVNVKLCDWSYSYLVHRQDVYFESKRIALTNRLEARPSGKRADDIADLGVLLLEMLYGEVFLRCKSVEQFLSDFKVDMDSQLYQLLSSIFSVDGRNRLTASDILSSEYLRAQVPTSTAGPSSSTAQHNVSLNSRYISDFEELAFIGEGGFGTVVKARNRLDGRVYAIKKITTTTESHVLREVSGLARLNHPSIVRYFASWVETASPKSRGRVMHGNSFSSSSSSLVFDEDEMTDDFMSTSGIVFATSSASKQDASSQAESQHVQLEPKPQARLLFIQMEYCSGNTLRTLIDEHRVGQMYWNFFAQIVDGVSYIHGQGLIHRDLKPANIFVSHEGQLKLGDFGLATETTVDFVEAFDSVLRDDDMTGDVGTFMYQAPELSKTTPVYDTKVDIYALGIIFGELTCDWNTGMERINILRGLRSPDIICPSGLNLSSKEVLIMKALLQHDPGLRPSASKLSAMLPPVAQKGYIQDTLKLLEEDGTFRDNVLSSLFSKEVAVSEYTYESQSSSNELALLSLRSIVTASLRDIFRRHGAIDRSTAADDLFPVNPLYKSKNNVVKLLDEHSNVLQLPFDLKLPFARRVARTTEYTERSFVISNVFRKLGNMQPRALVEADFDLVESSTSISSHFGVETLRVANEIVSHFPLINIDAVVYLGHSQILWAILAKAQVKAEDFIKVASVLNQLVSSSKRHSKSAWRRSLATLLPDSSIQELVKYMPQEDPAELETDICTIIEMLDVQAESQIMDVIDEIRSFARDARTFHVNIPIHFQAFTPNPGTYDLTYSVQYGSTELLCVGGRYDALLRKQSFPGRINHKLHAAGFSLAVDKITRLLTSNHSSLELPRQLDVVVSAFAHEGAAVELITRLWDNQITAGICREENTAQFCTDMHAALLISFRDKKHTTSHQHQICRVKNLDSQESTEVTFDLVVNHIISELSETMKKKQSSLPVVPRLLRTSSTRKEPETIIVSTDEHRKMKLPQRQLIASKANDLVRELSDSLREADIPILVVDFDSEQMQLIRSFDARRVAGGDESAARKVTENVKFNAIARAHFSACREQIARLQNEAVQRVFLYSFRCTDLILLNI